MRTHPKYEPTNEDYGEIGEMTTTLPTIGIRDTALQNGITLAKVNYRHESHLWQGSPVGEPNQYFNAWPYNEMQAANHKNRDLYKGHLFDVAASGMGDRFNAWHYFAFSPSHPTLSFWQNLGTSAQDGLARVDQRL